MSSSNLGLTVAAAAVGAAAALLVSKAFGKRTIVKGGPLFSAAQGSNGLLFVSGQLGLKKGVTPLALVDGGVKEQTIAALDALKAVLEKSGSSLDKVLHTRW